MRGVGAGRTPIQCALGPVNPLPINDLGQGWRNVAPVLKGVKQYLCNDLGT